MSSSKTKNLVYIALIGAMAYVLARFTKFSIFPALPFLKLDFGEVPLLLITAGDIRFGIAALLLKELLSLTLSGSNILGLIADFLACGTFLALFHLVMQGHKTFKRIAIATVIGALGRMLIAIPVNLLILWLQFGTDAMGVWAQMPWILLFNLIKCILDGACAAYLYPKLTMYFQKLRQLAKAT